MPGDKVLEVDARKRVTLGALAQHKYYLAAVEEGGVIVLMPAVILPASEVQKLFPALEAVRLSDSLADDVGGCDK
jgi:hypothetical protein